MNNCNIIIIEFNYVRYYIRLKHILGRVLGIETLSNTTSITLEDIVSGVL